MKSFFISVILIAAGLGFSSWGFFAHQRINRLAVFTLPKGISRFYKSNIRYLSEHAVDPDKRRYADTSEAARHYLDAELYEQDIDSIPERWNDAVLRYGTPKLNKDGILPWQIQRSYYNLVQAFKNRDSLKILIHSAYLGHYLADAHVPLHTTKNHNGQLTNQVGIHAFWESRLPELFSRDYNFLVGKALYIENPLREAWKIVKHSHSLVDSVLNCEAALNLTFKAHKKYSFSKRNGLVMRQYADEYTKAYQNLMNGMVERQMRSSILAIGSFWYTAWVDAGQPDLEHLVKTGLSSSEERSVSEAEYNYKQGKIIGREN
ncbi:zinc dependent phospholipase C family protein [Pedobacter metabolipauper]|uniref:Zinc dependent phospholipase C n=1 Tax=Pedobacter metabolipauper TaxID=425513 RepID=A0A4R6SUY5_9SPHI|nr:zinc dependent phospholipase C family protein [Pedobacter metabolipauper]TDQ08550.1 zinc dependent phospholipase C [Pedobacter metabolipauper]